ncbi:hypothetical protein J8J04_01080 ['Fragaria x ananassa' phyllody phytoplasma]|uniref:Uncharacterized protein n=1 Tax='Fragaria x ananassa' phyllody phytoplasma TaxID=2358428 RepID=A0ABS5K3K0_9MOLU|nr:hypothetical protein ['Fragaria x ananassa' phyllody phytoplasma]MBS2126294.1 hypothetical protein ['Fragaria x ananassa' phyllody phytoplasma]
MEQVYVVLIILLTVVIFLIMNYSYQNKTKDKIKKYLLSCESLEQEVLKSFLQESQKDFLLTKDAAITKKLLKLKIIEIKTTIVNHKCNSYILNPLVKKVIKDNRRLTKMYLNN